MAELWFSHTGNTLLVNNSFLFFFKHKFLNKTNNWEIVFILISDCVQIAVWLNYTCLKFFLTVKLKHITPQNNSYEMTFVLGREWKPQYKCYYYKCYYWSLETFSFLSHSHTFCFIKFGGQYSATFFLQSLKKYWNIASLQCCVSFSCTTKSISYMYTYIPRFFGFPSCLDHCRVLSRLSCAIQ